MELADLQAELDDIRQQTACTGADRAWKIASRIAVALAVPAIVGSWSWFADLAKVVQRNDSRIEMIEATRFLSADAAAMESRLLQALARQREEVPRWLQDAISRIEKDGAAAQQKLEAMTERLSRIEAKLENK